MGQALSYAVEAFDGDRFRQVAEFRRLDDACRAASRSIRGKVTLAVVKDLQGRLIYAADQTRDWKYEMKGGDAIP